MAVRACGQHGANVGMEALVSRADFLHLALRGPGLGRQPVRRFRDAGDEIDFALRRGNVVDDDVPVHAPPLGAGRTQVQSLEPSGGEDGAVGDAALVDRLVGSQNQFAHQRMHAIGAHYRVGDRVAAVGKCQPNALRRLIETHQLPVEMNDFSGYGTRQGSGEVGAVHAEVGRAEQVLRHRQLPQDPARIPFPVEVGIGFERGLSQRVLDADPAQHLH